MDFYCQFCQPIPGNGLNTAFRRHPELSEGIQPLSANYQTHHQTTACGIPQRKRGTHGQGKIPDGLELPGQLRWQHQALPAVRPAGGARMRADDGHVQQEAGAGRMGHHRRDVQRAFPALQGYGGLHRQARPHPLDGRA